MLSNLWALILEMVFWLVVSIASWLVGETAFVEFGFSTCSLSVFGVAVCVVCYLR